MRFGTDRWIDGEIADTRLFARRRVWRRFSNGKLPSVTMALSVKSIASCWSYLNESGSGFKQTGAKNTYSGDTEIFDSGDFIACELLCK